MILDEQVQHMRLQSLLGLAMWLVQKWTTARLKKQELSERLEELREEKEGLSENELREEWAAQVKAQTAPLPRK